MLFISRPPLLVFPFFSNLSLSFFTVRDAGDSENSILQNVCIDFSTRNHLRSFIFALGKRPVVVTAVVKFEFVALTPASALRVTCLDKPDSGSSFSDCRN